MELLVVIGIIAIIIALLLPALAGARHQANVVRWKAYLHELEAEPEVVAVYDFQVDNQDMPADGNGNIVNSSVVLQNKAIGNPSDRLSTNPSNLDGQFAGTITGNAAQNPSWVQGRWNGKGALKFTGSLKQFVDCGNARDWSRITSGYTIACWFKPLDTSSGAIVGREYGPTHSNPYYSWLAYDSGGTPQMRTDYTYTYGNTLRQNDWNHIVCTFGQSGFPGMYLNLYQDDVKISDTVYGGTSVYPSTQNVRIGSGAGTGDSNASPPDPLTGEIDEIVIFNTTMQDWSTPFSQEVDKLYVVGQAARQ